MHIELQGFYCNNCRRMTLMDTKTLNKRQCYENHYLCDECDQKERSKRKMKNEKNKEDITQNS